MCQALLIQLHSIMHVSTMLEEINDVLRPLFRALGTRWTMNLA